MKPSSQEGFILCTETLKGSFLNHLARNASDSESNPHAGPALRPWLTSELAVRCYTLWNCARHAIHRNQRDDAVTPSVVVELQVRASDLFLEFGKVSYRN